MTDHLASWAALLSSIAAILNAIAWPGVALWFLLANRVRIAFLLKVCARKLSMAKKVKVGQVELEAFEDDVKGAVIEASAQISDTDPPKSVPLNQVRAAKALGEKVREANIPVSTVRDTVRREIYELAHQYEIVRETLSSGHLRTRKMNEIAAGMRALAIAGLGLRSELTRSDSVGRRLAAICMFQVEPRPRNFRWLIDRVKTESQPFVFYHAAVAILELVKRKLYINPVDARLQIEDALRVISDFQGGEPDQNTVDVLKEALNLVK